MTDPIKPEREAWERRLSRARIGSLQSARKNRARARRLGAPLAYGWSNRRPSLPGMNESDL